MPFCPYCGKSVKEQHKFCPSCGKELETLETIKVENDSHSLIVPGETAEEKIKIIIPNLSKPKSFGRFDVFNLIVTEKRSIFAKLTNNIMNETIKMRRLKAESEGKGFFGKWKAQMQGFNTYTDWYKDKTPEHALKENQENFEIDNSDIKNLKIREESDEDGGMTQYEIEIITITNKLKYKTQYDPTELFEQAYSLTKN